MIPIVSNTPPAYAATWLTISQQHLSKTVSDTYSTTDWHQVDQALINAIKKAYDSTEIFVTSELNNWEDELIEKVDEKFLNWYFSYFHQKTQEFGIPFAWLAFKLDTRLKLLRKEDEKQLNASEVLQKRMIEDLNKKFQTLVLDEKAQKSLDKLVERAKTNYISLIGLKFTQVKSVNHISDTDWERYLNALANITYNTGTIRGDSSAGTNVSNTFNKTLIASTAYIGGKSLATFAAKAAAKISAKTGGAIASKLVLVDPMLAIGILLWDIWDYHKTVEASRPILRQSILEFLDELKYSILDSPDNGIMASIKGIEYEIITRLEAGQTL